MMDKRRCHKRDEKPKLEFPPLRVEWAVLGNRFVHIARAVAEKTEKRIAPHALRLTVLAVTVNGQPIDGIAVLVLPVAVAGMMAHMNPVVISLGKTDDDGFEQAKGVIHPAPIEIRCV